MSAYEHGYEGVNSNDKPDEDPKGRLEDARARKSFNFLSTSLTSDLVVSVIFFEMRVLILILSY